MLSTVAVVTPTGPLHQRVAATDLATAFAGNTGNTIFMDALFSMLPFADRLHDPGPETLAQYEHVVLSLANLVSQQPLPQGLSKLVDTLRHARQLNPHLRYVVSAVGAQHYGIDEGGAIHQDRLALIRFLSESAEFLGVRGHYTAELLADHGIMNTWVVGDPGLLHPLIKNPSQESSVHSGIVTHWTPIGHYRDVYRDFLAWGRDHDAYIVAQSADERLMPGSEPNSVACDTTFPELLGYYTWPYETSEGLESWMMGRGRWFGVPSAWYEFLRDKRLSIGTRFHGNVAAVIAGVPALQFTVDSRTAELSSFHGLPSMPLQNFDARRSPDDYLALADMRTLYARLPLLRANLNAFWAAVTLDVTMADCDPISALPGCVATSITPASTWERQLSVRDRYLRRAIAHAQTLDAHSPRAEAQDRSVLEAIALPRSEAYGELIDASAGITHAVRTQLPPDLATQISRSLNVPD